MATLSPSRRGLPRRRQPVSTLRRATRAVLVAGTVLALVAANGSIWVVRAGVVVAVAGAVAAVVLAWRELTAERREHAHAMLAANRAHGRQLHAERAQGAAIVETLTARARVLAARIETQQQHAVQLRTELASERGKRSRLSAELARRENQIGSLRRTIREQAVEIEELSVQLAASPEQGDAEVHALPRRVRIDEPAEAEVARELGQVGRRTFQLTAADPILMPNYEGELRLA